MLSLNEIGFVGVNLKRPECVLAHSSGSLLVPHWQGNGGICFIDADGTVDWFSLPETGMRLRPNGIALEADGTVLLAHLGEETGGIFSFRPDGRVSPLLMEIDGRALPPTNFCCRDDRGRLWITVSTRYVPRAKAYRSDIGDGFIVLLHDGEARIVADGLGYTNECVIAPDDRTLFVNETFGRRISTYTITANGDLGTQRTVCQFGEGVFPDGLALDADGRLWMTSIVSNRVIRVETSGRLETIIEDCVPEHVTAVEDAFRSGSMGRRHLDTTPSKVLRNVSSLAFGGKDLRTAYLGSLLGDAVAHFQTGVAGLAPRHWTADLSAWRRAASNEPLTGVS